MHTKPQQVSTIDFLFVTGLQEMVVCNTLFRIALEQSHQRKENPEQNTPEQKNKTTASDAPRRVSRPGGCLKVTSVL
jgi:hypothetical protein